MDDRIHDMVRAGYGAVARSRAGRDEAPLSRIAAAFGYTPEDLRAAPGEANLGVSCGNPVALASLQPGETVLDLGCGGGFDVFLAAEKVGAGGRVIGLDMTPEMIALARANAVRRGTGNVEFVEAAIEAMPVDSASIDCVISNCVLNLVPDKNAALNEIFRVLKPGGRLAVSDIALRQPLPEALRGSVTAWVGCIAGALTAEENRIALEKAGFTDIAIVDAGADLNVYKQAGQDGCCAPSPAAAPATSACCAPSPAAAPATSGCCAPSPAAAPAASACCAPAAAPANACPDGGKAPSGQLHADMSDTFGGIDINIYAASVKIFALRPVTPAAATA